MASDVQLSIVIVNYNSGSYALDCVRSLQKQAGITFEVILVDNASQDNSVSLLREQLGSSIRLIESRENLGFGRANNLAASYAKGEFLLLLNPDTVIASTNVLKLMVDALKNSPQVGMLGPAIDEPRKNKQAFPRYSYPSSSHLKYTKKFKHLPGKIAWLLGACLLFRRSVFNVIGGFDPDYFLYGEDADIGLKIRQAGYEIAYMDTVRITHVSGASEIGANTLDKWLRKKRGLFLFCAKHFDKRDALRLANRSILKSRFYLAVMYAFAWLHKKTDTSYQEKKHRLQATITAAEELKSRLYQSAI